MELQTSRRATPTTPYFSTDFAQYQGKRIAIVLRHRDEARVFQGAAQYENDDRLGPLLRIRLKQSPLPGATDLVISERDWNGRIVPDSLHGCDFLFLLA